LIGVDTASIRTANDDRQTSGEQENQEDERNPEAAIAHCKPPIYQSNWR